MSLSVQPLRVINIEDLRQAAKRRLPRVVFDYIDGGAEAEQTLRDFFEHVATFLINRKET